MFVRLRHFVSDEADTVAAFFGNCFHLVKNALNLPEVAIRRWLEPKSTVSLHDDPRWRIMTLPLDRPSIRRGKNCSCGGYCQYHSGFSTGQCFTIFRSHSSKRTL